MKITQADWASYIVLGLFDFSLETKGTEISMIRSQFSYADKRLVVSLRWSVEGTYHACAESIKTFELNKWYHCVLTYDKPSNSASLVITEKATGNMFTTLIVSSTSQHRLKIYNGSGQLVKTLVNDNRDRVITK